ncbi:MAG: phosphoribosylaminoimidazole-succinocarboxamide synthase [Deltaproteobacteria bacterium SM23_61]|nr:MAG: phosphoribosylaminoimidazole-succinocarboxamide synthase [Deltaproteobacteria bacterium SM23_61]
MVLLRTEFKEIPILHRGKVRDIYDLGKHLLIVATDRISAFDVVLPDGIPHKGRVLCQISAHWFRTLEDVVPHHMVTTGLEGFPGIPTTVAEALRGRAMVVKKAKPLPVECIVRGFLSGSGWNEYQEKGSVSGIPLPAGLKESQKLPAPLFTPSTKAEAGVHDENIDFAAAAEKLGKKLAEEVRSASLEIYRKAAAMAEKKGILIADTKFEFGLGEDGKLILIDEALTPDSSRFWPLDGYAPGGAQKSFDKQFVRDYLLSIRWDKKPPAPNLPAEVIQRTSEKYREAFERLTGKKLEI